MTELLAELSPFAQKYFLHESASNIESDDYFMFMLPSRFKMASLAGTLFSKKATGIVFLANYTVSVTTRN